MTDRTRTLLPDEITGFELTDPDGRVIGRFPKISGPPPAAKPEPGVTESALKRGALNVGSDFSNFAGMVTEAFGGEEAAQSFYDKADEFTKRSQVYEPTIGRVENIQSIGDAGVYAWEVLLENAPMLATLVVPGGLVGKGAAALGASSRGAQAAGATAAFLSDVGLQTGESASIAREGKHSPVDARVVGSGIGKAALDFVPLLGIARRLGIAKNLPIAGKIEKTIFGELADRGFIRRAARAGAGIAAVEVPTEVAQEVLNIALSRALSDFEGDLTDEEKSQLINAAAGAGVFGLLGIPAGIRKPDAGVQDPSDGATPEGVDIQITEVEETLHVDLQDVDTTSPVDFSTQGAVVIEDGPTPALGPLEDTVPVVDPELPALEPQAALQQQKDAAKLALEPEAQLEPDMSYTIDISGQFHSPMNRDPILDAIVDPADGPISQGIQLTAEQLVVASSYPVYKTLDPTTPLAQNLAGLHPGLQGLFTARDELVQDEDNYRTTDGLLKKAAERKLSTIDTRIRVLQERLGINPESYNTLEATPENVQLQEPVVETPPTGLTEGQSRQLERLNEKETTEGLTQAEFETYEELLAIQTGEIKPETRAQTAAELEELKTLTKEVRADETVRLASIKDQGVEPGQGLSAVKAKEILTKFSSNFVFGPTVHLVTRQDPRAIKQMHRTKREMRGWWNPRQAGHIFIIPTNHATERDLIQTYLHETLAHYGLGAMYTEAEKTELLMDILREAPPGLDIKGIRERAADEGIGTDLLRDMEEYIADIAETAIINPKSGLVQMSWWKRFIAGFKRKLRLWTGKNLKWTDNDLLYLLRDNGKLLTGQVTPRNLAGTQRYYPKDGAFARAIGPEATEAANSAIDSQARVWGARFNKLFLTPLQFAEKYNVPGAREFLEFVQQWWARKRILTDYPAQIAQSFMRHGPRDQKKLSEAVLKVSIRSDEEGRKLTQEEINEVFKEVGIENDTALKELWSEMDKSFQTVVSQLRSGLETIAIRTQGNPEGEKISREAAQSLQRRWAVAKNGTAEQKKKWRDEAGVKAFLRVLEIDEEMKQLENRNYFPRMRFGTWSITVRAKKDMMIDGTSYRGPRDDARGEVVYYESYESQSAQAAAFEDLKKQMPESTHEMQMGKIADNEFHFMGTITPQLYESLMGKIPDMTDAQKEVVRELYLRQAPGRSFLRHLTKRKGIAGYSEDVLRVYSSYMMNVANHIARVEYHIDMNEQLGVVRDNAVNTTPDARVEGVVREYFQDQYDYLMNPKNDWAQARAVGFLWYLGANVKSAVVNLTQVPMVAYPFLASRYGDLQSSGAILNALKMVTRKKNGEVMPAEIRKQLERAVREGFVDESRATELAGLAEQSTLQRILPVTDQGKLLANASFYGAWLFQKAERFNREVTFVAAYNLAKQNGITSQEEAFKLGREAVQAAMFEYAKWNRPAFMRGKKSVFFLFWQYMQGLSYLAFGGKGQGTAMRVWMMLLLAGGLQGLPFAENILDILDFVGSKTKERLGMKDPRTDLRNDLRALASEITDRPDMIMHGLSRYYGLGPMHLLNMAGVPVPNVDISGSISSGRILPGTDDAFGPSRDPSAKLGRTMVDVFGPVAGIPYQLWRSMSETNPDTWKVWERSLPVAFKNMSSAIRRGTRGEEEYRGGGQLAEFDVHDTEQRAELIANFLGFAPTRVNQQYEADFSIQNMKQYWAIRRALVMENVAYARMAGDPEGTKDAMDALREYNKTIPDPMLRINFDQLQRSLKQRFQRASLREKGIPSELLYRRIVRSMRELYPETEVDI